MSDLGTPGFSVSRRVVFVEGESDEKWIGKLFDAGFTESMVNDIYEFVDALNWLHKVDEGQFYHAKHSYVIAEAFYKNTWFPIVFFPGASLATVGPSRV